MPIFSLSSPSREPVVVDGVTDFKSEWMNTGDDPAFSPTVFLVEQPPKRQLHGQPVPIVTAAGLAAHVSPSIDDLIALEPDGIAARLYTLPPGTQHRGLDPAGSAGQFYVVLAGTLIAGERRLRP